VDTRGDADWVQEGRQFLKEHWSSFEDEDEDKNISADDGVLSVEDVYNENLASLEA
jgi:hypothetical protein